MFGAPEIAAASKDSRFTGEVFQEFPTARNIIHQAVIPGDRQSLWAKGSRHGLSRTIIDHVIGNRKPNSLGREEWGVSGNDDDALKFPCASIRRFPTWAESFRKDARNAVWAVGNTHL